MVLFVKFFKNRMKILLHLKMCFIMRTMSFFRSLNQAKGIQANEVEEARGRARAVHFVLKPRPIHKMSHEPAMPVILYDLSS